MRLIKKEKHRTKKIMHKKANLFTGFPNLIEATKFIKEQKENCFINEQKIIKTASPKKKRNEKNQKQINPNQNKQEKQNFFIDEKRLTQKKNQSNKKPIIYNNKYIDLSSESDKSDSEQPDKKQKNLSVEQKIDAPKEK